MLSRNELGRFGSGMLTDVFIDRPGDEMRMGGKLPEGKMSTVTNLERIESQGALVYGVLVYCITLIDSPFSMSYERYEFLSNYFRCKVCRVV